MATTAVFVEKLAEIAVSRTEAELIKTNRPLEITALVLFPEMTEVDGSSRINSIESMIFTEFGIFLLD